MQEFNKPQLEDLKELRDKIQSRLGSDYEVCINRQVIVNSGIFISQANFDIVIFYKNVT